MDRGGGALQGFHTLDVMAAFTGFMRQRRNLPEDQLIQNLSEDQLIQNLPEQLRHQLWSIHPEGGSSEGVFSADFPEPGV